MRLVVDGRKAFDSGIGTYIRAVLPRVLELLDASGATLLVARGTLAAHTYADPRRVTTVEIDAPPFSLAEQRELRRHLDATTMFWATSLAHPLWLRTPLVATVHDVAQLALGAEGGFGVAVRLASRVYLESLHRRSRALFVNSQFTRNELLRHLGSRAALPITVTPLGVEPDWFAARTQESAAPRPYFVCVGNVRPHKNLGVLLRALERVADRLPHDLVIVGQRSGLHATDDRLALARLGPRVRFAGPLPDSELRPLVAAADALVFPSLYEGFGLPALEAMAAGCAVIVSNAGALPEVCADAAVGFDPHSPDELAQRLLEHAGLTPVQRRARVDRGIAHARTFTWDRTAGLTAAALREAQHASAVGLQGGAVAAGKSRSGP